MVKLNTCCVQNVVTTWRGGLGRTRLGTDAKDFVFPGTGHTYPHLDEIHVLGHMLAPERVPHPRAGKHFSCVRMA